MLLTRRFGQSPATRLDIVGLEEREAAVVAERGAPPSTAAEGEIKSCELPKTGGEEGESRPPVTEQVETVHGQGCEEGGR